MGQMRDSVELYERYQQDPASVDTARAIFEHLVTEPVSAMEHQYSAKTGITQRI